jgi:Fe-S cluster biogenesis protein NfuA
MSDTAKQRRIRAQASARDPLSMRFLLDAPLQAGRSAMFKAADDDKAPLARALFDINGVAKLHVSGSAIIVTRRAEVDWQVLKAPIAAAIRQVLESTGKPLGPAPAAPSAARDDAALLAAVKDLLDRHANPAIASHGGQVSAERVENGTVYLRMSGGCQGCAASSATLRSGIETMLRSALPEIREIVDVTDHAAGANPYYTDAPGRSPALVRPVPASALHWEAGQLMIDPNYLAPKLGLDPDRLRAGLQNGEIVSRTETGRGAQAGKARVTVRSASRSWAAELLPDGSACEVPPPSTLSQAADVNRRLRDKVRRYLETLSTEDVPITYGQLARGLRMFTPGSIRKVTEALEATMREDAAAGRPFIAAFVVSRGSLSQPGRGFFDLARLLGRGPDPGQSDVDYYRQEIELLTEH